VEIAQQLQVSNFNHPHSESINCDGNLVEKTASLVFFIAAVLMQTLVITKEGQVSVNFMLCGIVIYAMLLSDEKMKSPYLQADECVVQLASNPCRIKFRSGL
jgi:hypothetical protein